MNRTPATHRPQAARCPFTWCTTEHGETVHPDDETHRSAGTAFAARLRDGRVGGVGVLTDVEVGVIRRVDDDESWVALEFGGGYAVELDAAAARTLGRLLLDVPGLTTALDRAESGDG